MTGKSVKKDGGEKKLADMESNIKDMESKAIEAEAKASEYLDAARRLQADFDNYRKRTEKEKEEFKRYAIADIAIEILTIADDLDRALSFTKQDSELASGVKAIQANLMKVLTSRGITEIEITERFDPNCHEALCVCEGDTDGEITEVFQKGYRMGDRILRYAKVKVTRIKEGE